MVLTCIKCCKQFRSNYLLEKHINQITPCDVILNCNRCNKNFKNKRDLDRHEARKNPCDISSKNANIEIKLKMLKLKNKTLIEIEKERTLRIEKKREAALAIADKMLEVEKEKTKRKEITAKIANQNADQMKVAKVNKIHDDAMLYINNYIQENDTIPYQHIDSYKTEINLMIRGFMMALEIFKDSMSIDEINERLLQTFLNSKMYPQYRKFFYVPLLEEYYTVVLKPNTDRKIPQVISYENIVQPVIYHILDSTYSIIHSHQNEIDVTDNKYKAILDHINIIGDSFNNNPYETKKKKELANDIKKEYVCNLNTNLKLLCNKAICI